MFVLLPLPDSAQKCDTLKTNRYSHYLFGAQLTKANGNFGCSWRIAGKTSYERDNAAVLAPRTALAPKLSGQILRDARLLDVKLCSYKQIPQVHA
jgi:hypothetical protein